MASKIEIIFPQIYLKSSESMSLGKKPCLNESWNGFLQKLIAVSCVDVL